jgi:Xaa-Pro dipeptidase
MIEPGLKDARRQKLLAAMETSDAEAVAIVPGANFYHLTGAHFHLMERPTVLFVTRAGALHAVIPELEKARWQALAPEVETDYWQDSDGFDAAFASVARRLNASRIGVEGQRMRVFEAEALRRAFRDTPVLDAHAAISSIRLHKDEAEIAAMEKAIAISETALAATLESVRPGMSEWDVRGRLLAAMLAEGADGAAFDPIVLAGGAAADPHGSPSAERVLTKGDPLLIDFGAAWGGYNADITRTFFVGEASARHRAVYEAVLAANEKGRAIARPGLTMDELDRTVTGVLVEAGFADLVVHKTGHGLGQEVHEAPQVMKGNLQPAEPGMVVTIEPGLYRTDDVGVRIEDDVLITGDGCRSLSAFPRELTLVGESVR